MRRSESKKCRVYKRVIERQDRSQKLRACLQIKINIVFLHGEVEPVEHRICTMSREKCMACCCNYIIPPFATISSTLDKLCNPRKPAFVHLGRKLRWLELLQETKFRFMLPFVQKTVVGKLPVKTLAQSLVLWNSSKIAYAIKSIKLPSFSPVIYFLIIFTPQHIGSQPKPTELDKQPLCRVLWTGSRLRCPKLAFESCLHGAYSIYK